jgi:probable rRNA maturation factor
MAADLDIVLVNRQRRRRVEGARLRRILRRAARSMRVSGEVALVIGGDRRLRGLNARYRGQDRPTDVLSFPGPCGEGPARRELARQRTAHRATCPRCGGGLGDIVISVDTAERNARLLGRSLARELDILALHGLLHVLGYDHETDDGTMDRLEGRLRRRFLRDRGGRGPVAGKRRRP